MKTYYTAVQSGNWNDPKTWKGEDAPSNQPSGIVTITIPNNIEVTIPKDLEVHFGAGVMLQILGGTFNLEGSLTIVKNSINEQEGNDHSIADNGEMLIGKNGILNMTVQGNSHPLIGLTISDGSLTNNGSVSITCRTGTDPNVALAYGISNSGSLTNNGTITIDSPDNINNGGYGPSFGIWNRDDSTIVNNAGASITAKDSASTIGGGIINNTSKANFQNKGSFNFKYGQFWNEGSFSGIAIGDCSVEASSAASWSDRIGPMSGNQNILIALNNGNCWFVESDTVKSGVVLKKGGSVSGDDISSAGYSKNEFIAVGPYINRNNQNEIFKSTDGKNWNSVHQSVSGADIAMNAVSFGSDRVIAVGYKHDTVNGVYALGDSDAASWQTGTMEGIVLNDIAFGDVGHSGVTNKFLATSSSKTYTSNDGENWTKKDDSSKSNICYSPTHKFFYGITQNTGLVYRTGNGMWTKPIGMIWDAEKETNHINDFIWSEEAQLFIAVGSEGTEYKNGELPSAIFISPDGTNWSKNLYNQGKELMKVAYGAGVLIAVGYNKTIIQIIT